MSRGSGVTIRNKRDSPTLATTCICVVAAERLSSNMASNKPNKLAFLSMPAPASYVAGLGRG